MKKHFFALGALCLTAALLFMGCSAVEPECAPQPPCPPEAEAPKEQPQTPPPAPEPKPEPKPEPQPEPQPEPKPEPKPQPEPKPEPEPQPAPAPEPVSAEADAYSEEEMRRTIESIEKIKTEEPEKVREIVAAAYADVPSVEENEASEAKREEEPEKEKKREEEKVLSDAGTLSDADRDSVYKEYLDIESYIAEQPEHPEQPEEKREEKKEEKREEHPAEPEPPAEPEARPEPLPGIDAFVEEAGAVPFPLTLSPAPATGVPEVAERVESSLSLDGFEPVDFDYFGQLSKTLLDPEG